MSTETTAAEPKIPLLEDGDVPDNIRESQYFQEFLERLADGRDMRTIIDAMGNETGVGKTLLGSNLACLQDIWGFNAEEKATLNAREYMDIYSKLPPGSCCYLQEAEKSGDRRRGMSKDVMQLGYIFAILRTRQIFGILDLPDATTLDDRIIKQCDYRILVKDRGEALVFEIDNNDFTGQKYFNKVEEIYWPDLDPGDNYEELSRQKEEWIQGEAEEKYIHRDEFEDAKKNFYRKFTKKTRYEMANGLWDMLENKDLVGRGGEITQSEFANAMGAYNEELALSQQGLSKLLNASEFTDVYSQ